MELLQKIKGTADLYGEKAYLYRFIVETATRLAESFCCDIIKLPTIEHLKLFQKGIGESTDVISKELFTWKDKAQRDLCLRPEGTAQTVRFLLENGQIRETLKRYFYVGSMFRAEKPQKGRQREFHQIGIEIFGESEPFTDAETIQYAVLLLKTLGITEFNLLLNSVGCLNCRPLYIKKLKEYFTPLLKELCSTCQNRFHTNPFRMLDCKEEKCQHIIKQAPSILDHLCSDCNHHFGAVKLHLNSLNIPFILNPRLVRGLDYYTQTAFEFTLNGVLGSQDSICGGGRYNNLVKSLSGKENIPAVGLALGVERLMIALEILKHPILEEYHIIDCMVITEEKYLHNIVGIISNLRLKGLKVLVDFQEKNISKKISRAHKLKAQWVVIVGSYEIENNHFTLKNMINSEQIACNLETLQRILLSNAY